VTVRHNKTIAKFLQTHRTSWHSAHHQVVVGEWAQCDSQSKIGRRATEWATQPESGALPQRDRAQNFYKTFIYASKRGDRTFKRTHTFTGGGKRFWLRALLMKWKFFGAPIIFGSHPRIIVVNEQSASEPARRKVHSQLMGTRRPLYTALFRNLHVDERFVMSHFLAATSNIHIRIKRESEFKNINGIKYLMFAFAVKSCVFYRVFTGFLTQAGLMGIFV
jgi:hypothetical protein